MKQNRRQFLQASLLLTTWSVLPKGAVAEILRTARFTVLTDSLSPIAEITELKGTKKITGDTFDEAHEIFWNKEGFIAKKGGLPEPTETFDVIIAGAGISGLAAALALPKNKKILILEGHPRLGGNAKSEKHLDTYMALGSAYTTVPDEADAIDKFYEEIGVKDHFRKVSYEKSDLCFKDKIVSGFWEGSTDPKRAHDFKKVHDRLLEIFENEYPDLPNEIGLRDKSRNYFDRLDKMSFKEWVKNEFGEIHPHIEEYFHQYSWSSFGMGYEELSAAQALNFITSDLAGIQVLPGGNGAIAQKIYEKLKLRKNVTFRTKSFCADIRLKGDGVQVSYHRNNEKLEAVVGKKCIVAFPKMVAKHVIEGLAEAQKKAMDRMNYRAYLVANVIFKRKIPFHDYDLYSLIGEVPTEEYKESVNRVYTDLTFATWANEEEAQGSVITLYIPIPYHLGQQYLFIENLYEKYEARIRKRIAPFLENQGMSLNDIEGIRLTRYGHALPAAFKNGVASGTFEEAHRPIGDRIFFACQDNWGNPSVEAAIDSGQQAAKSLL